MCEKVRADGIEKIYGFISTAASRNIELEHWSQDSVQLVSVGHFSFAKWFLPQNFTCVYIVDIYSERNIIWSLSYSIYQNGDAVKKYF